MMHHSRRTRSRSVPIMRRIRLLRRWKWRCYARVSEVVVPQMNLQEVVVAQVVLEEVMARTMTMLETRIGQRPLQIRRWNKVDDKNSSGNNINQMPYRNMAIKEKSASHVSKMTMFAFNKTILLKDVRTRKTTVNPMRNA
ncbi:hypothetical protein L3X38_028070 [Prunus dulcis]|uniref:Uncharacterized protein n=1 Tax=Prunus dulcis TaxID=3755 RepID=A0AAD4Z1Q5_PRUDU|nr:hypothetical protein L3X38_028070 [Prunus dulcis]